MNPAVALETQRLLFDMDESGSIRIDENVIRHRSRVHGDWDLPIADIKVIGESTNQSGPFLDDYFICFASGASMWFEASVSTDGFDEFLEALSLKLNSPLQMHLASSTDFASRVLWPPSLEGEPMFDYQPAPPKGLLQRIFRHSQVRQTYAARIITLLTES